MSEEEKKTQEKWKVVGYNLLGLVAYTLLFRLVSGGILFDCFVVGAHFLIATIMAIAQKKWEWVLSAFLVLVIGFSTCVTFLGPTWNQM